MRAGPRGLMQEGVHVDEDGYDLVRVGDAHVRVFTRREFRKKSLTAAAGQGGESKATATMVTTPTPQNKRKARKKKQKRPELTAEQQKKKLQKKKARELHAKFKQKTRGRINGSNRQLTREALRDDDAFRY
mmetsp:Transcript_43822/g.70446  ORF Transcript_43822/g.70446 Transcript_43822/m.70446 type:complete len:131 (+) Transcript_43822:363-755(+)